MSTLLNCPHGHHWWEPFTDGQARPPGTQSLCPRCGTAAELPARAAQPVVAGLASTAPAPPPGEFVLLTVELTVMGAPLQGRIPVPTGPTRPRDFLPVFRGLAENVIDISVQRVEAEGEKVSCKKGCGACCRQLVPISETEAYQVRDLIADLPEPRRTEVRARFAEARRRLQAAGLLDKLLHPEQFSNDQLRPVGLEYFHLGIPCPFLDEESCSIHPERPIACREYLVTSPAENCAQPTAETVRCVPLATKVSNAVSRLSLDPGARFVRWVPLVLAPEWADNHPDETPPRPGPDVIREFFERLQDKKKEPAES
jgi:Fe-S-cluster containining protein